jgi:hypothetical protein
MLTGSIASIRFWSRRIGDWSAVRYSSVGDFGDSFGKFGALDGDLDDDLFDFGLALLLGEFAIYSRSTEI